MAPGHGPHMAQVCAPFSTEIVRIIGFPLRILDPEHHLNSHMFYFERAGEPVKNASRSYSAGSLTKTNASRRG